MCQPRSWLIFDVRQKMTARSASISVVVTLLALTACSHVSDVEPQVGPPPSLTSHEERAFERVIRDFARTKKWSPEAYSIKLVGGYSGVVVFSVAHRDDTTAGGGKSLVLHIDRAKQRIIHELASQ